MNLLLRRLPETVRGIYDLNKNGKPDDPMPKRTLLLHPDAFSSFLELVNAGGMVFSDIFRSAESSLHAVESGRGAQPPGYSGHNFGLATDVAVDETLKARSCTYVQLLEAMALKGWHCYRRDGQRGKEDWHFNYLGTDSKRILAACIKRDSWSQAAEESIMSRYAKDFGMQPVEIQAALKKLGMYNGETDGDIGPMSRAAAGAFARAWNLMSSDIAQPRFQRTLAFVSAVIDVEEITAPLAVG